MCASLEEEVKRALCGRILELLGKLRETISHEELKSILIEVNRLIKAVEDEPEVEGVDGMPSSWGSGWESSKELKDLLRAGRVCWTCMRGVCPVDLLPPLYVEKKGGKIRLYHKRCYESER